MSDTVNGRPPLPPIREANYVVTKDCDLVDMDAYVANVQFHLSELRSTIHDGLNNKSDLYLKVALLQDLDAAEAALKKV